MITSDHVEQKRPSAFTRSRAHKQEATAQVSELPGFYRLSLSERRRRLAGIAGLNDEEVRVISGDEGLSAEQANLMVENAVGVMGLPLALCANLRVDGVDRLVPMAVEEPSVVAAASHAAKLLRSGGGVFTKLSPPHMIGQIQLLDVPDPEAAERAILAARSHLLRSANSRHQSLVAAGGGATDVELRRLPPLRSDDPLGEMLVVHLIVDVRDAMGANAVNAMCEHLAPEIERLSGGRVRLRILSNLADRRTVVAHGAVPLAALEGKGRGSSRELARGIEEASVFAERDPYRAATHNKGVMNGIDAVLLAFGQDWRAVEAGAHAFACRDGRYTSLSSWRVDGDRLVGRLELPLAVGVVGGVTAIHPTSRANRQIARIEGAGDLASLAAAVGLAQNLGALRALAAEGIQRGHMRVHARNIAVAAGAGLHEVERVAEIVSEREEVNQRAAAAALRELRRGQRTRPVRQRFRELQQGYLPRILELIDEVIERQIPPRSTLVDMAGYHLRTGGKRLRALLPLMVAEAVGSDPSLMIPFGAACEVLHNATLVHDDLQDGDRFRRGLEAVWSRFGAPQAVDLGDAMFYLALLLADRLEVPLAQRHAVFRRVLTETLKVIDGQERELGLRRETSPTMEGYFEMVTGKTSGLFALPMAGSAELCRSSPSLVRGLEDAARQMGVLFQVHDDLLDLYGDKGRQSSGNDLREGKRSVLVVHALQNGAPDQRRWLLDLLDHQPRRVGPREVQQARELFRRTGSLEFAAEEITRRRERALHAPGLVEHDQLRAVVAGMCDLFLEPLGGLLAREEVAA